MSNIEIIDPVKYVRMLTLALDDLIGTGLDINFNSNFMIAGEDFSSHNGFF